MLLKWFFDSTLILTSKDLNTPFFFMVCFILENVIEKLVNLHFSKLCLNFSKSHFKFCGKEPRSSSGNLMFLTLDLLPSETMQIYNRGKPHPFLSVCSVLCFRASLPSCWMAQLLLGSHGLCPVVLRQWGTSGNSPRYVAQCLPVRVSVSHTVEGEKGNRKLEVGTVTIVPWWTVLICQSEHSIPGSWHSYDLPQAALIQKKNVIWRFLSLKFSQW